MQLLVETAYLSWYTIRGFASLLCKSAGLRLPFQSPCPAPYAAVHWTAALYGRALSGSNP